MSPQQTGAFADEPTDAHLGAVLARANSWFAFLAPGPDTASHGCGVNLTGREDLDALATLIGTDIPALVAEVRRLREALAGGPELARLRATLEQVIRLDATPDDRPAPGGFRLTPRRVAAAALDATAAVAVDIGVSERRFYELTRLPVGARLQHHQNPGLRGSIVKRGGNQWTTRHRYPKVRWDGFLDAEPVEWRHMHEAAPPPAAPDGGGSA